MAAYGKRKCDLTSFYQSRNFPDSLVYHLRSKVPAESCVTLTWFHRVRFGRNNLVEIVDVSTTRLFSFNCVVSRSAFPWVVCSFSLPMPLHSLSGLVPWRRTCRGGHSVITLLT